jgi:site-specific DNA recombinase
LGVKSIALHLNERGLTTRDGGRWGVSSVHHILTRTTYFGEHRFNTRDSKTGDFKADDEHVVMPIPPIIGREQFDAVQRLMTNRNPRTVHSRFVSGSTLLGGICFCGICGGAMTLRTGKSGQYRYYTCCSRARTGPKGRGGLTVPMNQVDNAVIDYLENRFLSVERLTDVLGNIIDERDRWVQRRYDHVGVLRKRATDAEAKLHRLLTAVEEGVMDASDRHSRTASRSSRRPGTPPRRKLTTPPKPSNALGRC